MSSGAVGDAALSSLKWLVADIDWSQAGVLGCFALAINLLWDTYLVYPLKLLVVFLHESSHGLMAILTGGTVLHMEVSPDEAGVCYTQGGNRFLTLSAGYLGSMLWGGLILNLATHSHHEREVSGVMGAVIVIVGVIFVRPVFSFGLIFACCAGVALCAAGYHLPAKVNSYVLQVTGLTSCLYAVLDIRSDILERPGVQSDARMLEEETHIPTLIWGMLWISIAVSASISLVLVACKRDSDYEPVCANP